MTVVASLPETIFATLSLMPTRDPISPAKRCPKYDVGSCSMCVKNLLDVDSESFVSRRSR